MALSDGLAGARLRNAVVSMMLDANRFAEAFALIHGGQLGTDGAVGLVFRDILAALIRLSYQSNDSAFVDYIVFEVKSIADVHGYNRPNSVGRLPEEY